MPLKILLENNKLVRKGRPAFPASTNKNIPVIKGLEDRRHILHGATQISDVLISSFNRLGLNSPQLAALTYSRERVYT